MLEYVCRNTRCRHANVLTYFDDLDHDLKVVKYRTGSNNTDIQETKQRLLVLERKILRTNMVINKYRLHQEGIPLGWNVVITGKNLVETVSFVIVLVVSLTFVVMAVQDLGRVGCQAIGGML